MNIKDQTKIIKILFMLALGFITIFSFVNLINPVNIDNPNTSSCKEFVKPAYLNQHKNTEISISDIYVFPEVNNLLCLNKAISFSENETTKFLIVGTNSKVLNYFSFVLFFFLFVFSRILKYSEVLIYNLFFVFFILYNFSYSANFFTYTIIIFFTLFIYTIKKNESKSLLDLPDIFYKPFISSGAFLIFAILIIITQFSTHNYETLDWDINSYLVTSLDIKNGYLPYEIHYENKPPFLFFIYYLVGKIANGNLLIVKVINDLVLLLCTLNLYLLLKRKNNIELKAIIGSILFISFMSKDWFHPGFSEVYSLFFISLSLLMLTTDKTKRNLILSGLFFSISTLINLGTVIFLIPIFLSSDFINKKIYNFSIFFSSFSGLHLLILFIYFFKGLIDNYLVAMVTIPRNYPRESTNILKEFGISIQDISQYSLFAYLAVLIILTTLVANFFIGSVGVKKTISSSELLFFTTSLMFYFMASMGYQHHLIFALFFACFSISVIKSNQNIIFITLFSILSFVNVFNHYSIGSKGFYKSYENILNSNELVASYPLNNAADIYFSDISSDDTVLALDNFLLLYYLDKGNFSYISHPSLYKKEFVINPLAELNLVDRNEIEKAISLNPDYIICSNLIIECENLNGYEQLNTKQIDINYLHYYLSSQAFGTQKTLLIFKKTN